jgi:hypothetical protein
VLDVMVEGLELKVFFETARFEPEGGAYPSHDPPPG